MSKTPWNKLLPCFVLLMILCISASELYAQQRGGRGSGGGGGRQRPGGPPPAAPAATGGAAAQAEVETGPGTVPDLVGAFNAGKENAAALKFVENAAMLEGIVPVVPEKVIRYATTVFNKYDTNNDGFLDREEWAKMPGAPQSIDIDGDFVITLEEYLRFIALYGNARTIHRPNPPVVVRQTTDLSGFVSFHPLSAAPKSKEKPTDEAEKPKTEEKTDETELKIDEETSLIGARDETTEDAEASEDGEKAEKPKELSDEELDDFSYEIVLGGKSASARRYYVPLSEFRGLPSWFFSLDRDGDGQLSLVEFAPNLAAARLAQFSRLDKNGDGFISIEEMREAMQAQKKQE